MAVGLQLSLLITNMFGALPLDSIARQLDTFTILVPLTPWDESHCHLSVHQDLTKRIGHAEPTLRAMFAQRTEVLPKQEHISKQMHMSRQSITTQPCTVNAFAPHQPQVQQISSAP
mmetsp:Transcript_7842/g.14606  ORF Transcript_7842/g.14606 Transcript_7842/m.14606 type:complete len:116 (+) Transcript_7842:35-382(+)